jgi:uncharacterized protein (DUF427 family)
MRFIEQTNPGISCALRRVQKGSQPAIKACYWHVPNNQVEDELLEKAARSYTKPFDGADAIKDYIAFDPSRIQIIEHV